MSPGKVLILLSAAWPIWLMWAWLIKSELNYRAREEARLQKERLRFQRESNLRWYRQSRMKEVKKDGNERPQDREVFEESETGTDE
jgi:hypothetical protein